MLAWQSGVISFSQPETLSGRVVYQGEAPRPAKLLVIADVAVCGKTDHYDDRLQIGTNNGIKDAVVWLERVEGGKSLASMGSEFVLDQRGCTYLPHVLLAPVNTPVQILNNDAIFHNVHTYSSANTPVNLPHPHFKKKLEMVFTAAEKISVRCDVHGWMSGWIIAVDHPYYATTDAEGGFALSDIPPGHYTVHCWQELLGAQQARVKIAAGAQVTLDFTYRPAE